MMARVALVTGREPWDRGVDRLPRRSRLVKPIAATSAFATLSNTSSSCTACGATRPSAPARRPGVGANRLGLPEAAGTRHSRHVQQIMHEPRQVEDHRHPVVRVRRVELVAEDLAGDSRRCGARLSSQTPRASAIRSSADRPASSSARQAQDRRCAPGRTRRWPPRRRRGSARPISASGSPVRSAMACRRSCSQPTFAAIARAASTTSFSIAPASVACVTGAIPSSFNSRRFRPVPATRDQATAAAHGCLGRPAV